MAESVDALVSNTSRFTPVPVRPRLWVQKAPVEQLLRGFLLFKTSKMVTFGHHFKKGGHFSTHPLAAGALPKFESVLGTTFSLYMVVCEQVPTTPVDERWD